MTENILATIILFTLVIAIVYAIKQSNPKPPIQQPDGEFVMQHLRNLRNLEESIHNSEIRFAHLSHCWEQVFAIVRDWEERQDTADHERYFKALQRVFQDLQQTLPAPADRQYKEAARMQRLMRRIKELSRYDAEDFQYVIQKESLEKIHSVEDRLALQFILGGSPSC